MGDEVRPRLKARQVEQITEHAKEESEPLWVTLDRILEEVNND